MRAEDAVWYRGENARNPMMVSSILWFDRPLDIDRLRAVVTERVVERHPVFRQRVVPSRNPLRLPRWEDDPEFDLDRHLEVIELPAPGDHEGLQRRCSAQRSTPLDRARPLWMAHVFQGYADGGSAMHVRIHHSLADGLALMRLLIGLADEDPTGPEPADDPTRLRRGLGLLRRAEHLAADVTRTAVHPGRLVEQGRLGVSVATWAGRLLAPDLVPGSVLIGRPTGRKLMAWDPVGLPVEAVKAAGRAAGATVNDVLLTLLTGALHRYLAERDALVDEAVVMVPVDLRVADAPLPRHLGNRIGLLPVRLPVGLTDAEERLRTVRARIEVLKHSPAPPLSRTLLIATTLGTPTVERAIHRLNQLRSTGVVTNVRGPDHAIHLAGARLIGTVGWGGMTGHLNLSAAFISIGGRIFAGIVTDEGITEDPERILHHLREEWDAVGRPVAA